MSLKASYARGCKQRPGRCTSLSKVQLITPSCTAPPAFLGGRGGLANPEGSLHRIIKILMLMKVWLLQFPPDWCMRLLDPTAQDVPRSPVCARRTENMRGVEKDSLSSKYQFPGQFGSPQHYCITHCTEACLVHFFQCFRNKRLFFQIALGGKFFNSVIENVRQYSLLELLTFLVVVTL